MLSRDAGAVIDDGFERGIVKCEIASIDPEERLNVTCCL